MVKVVLFRRCFFLGFSSSDSFPSPSGESGHADASAALLAQHPPAAHGADREKLGDANKGEVCHGFRKKKLSFK